MELAELTVDAESFGRSMSALDRMVDAAVRLHITAGPAIAREFHKMERKRFDQEGPGWERLSSTTLALRRKRGSESEHIMIDHGNLVGSLTMSDAPGAVVRTSFDEIFIGTAVTNDRGQTYAEYHQTGPRTISVFGRGTARLPERKLVEVDEAQTLRFALIVRAALRPGTSRGTATAEVLGTTIPELD